jgi:LmbE family N-acetylglucosaminyl deacetylase
VKVLAIGAHPDDIEYSCGGTLIRHAQRGDEVYLLVMTSGGMGGEPETRRAEQAAAARIIGAKEVFFGGYSDTRLVCDRDTIMKIEEHVQRIGADTVYTHCGEDTHQDHRALAQAVVPAARSVPNLLFFDGFSAQNFTPSVFVNIGGVINQKLAALKAHVSQVEKTNIEDMNIVDIARSAANFRGIQGRVTYAEGFVPLRHFIDFA